MSKLENTDFSDKGVQISFLYKLSNLFMNSSKLSNFSMNFSEISIFFLNFGTHCNLQKFVGC